MLVLPLVLLSMAATACPTPAGHATQLDGDGLSVQLAPEPAPIPVGQHFDFLVEVCRDGAPVEAEVTVDADMPAHGHGMNYQPSMTTLGPGKVRASGLMFHMPGTWRVVVTVEEAAGRQVFESSHSVP